MRKQRNVQIHWQIKLFFVLTVLSSLVFLLNTPAFAAPGDITTVAGPGFFGFSGDGGPATEAQLHFPDGVFVDGAGNLFIADTSNDGIRRVDGQTGIITTVAGTGERGFGFSGDGGKATEARLFAPPDVFVDGAGNLFIADWGNNRIRRVDGQTGIITTVAGTGAAGFLRGSFSGDGGKATEAQLDLPPGVFVDGAGNLFIADWGNNRIRRVDGQTGIITTVAGTGAVGVGEGGFSGDGGPATKARLDNPFGVFVDEAGNLFIADTNNHRIRRVDGQTGIITTVAGTGEADFSGDGGPATEAQLASPQDVFVDGAGNLFIADRVNARIRRVDGQTGIITTVAGTGEEGFSGDGGKAIEAGLNHPRGVFVDGAGNLFIADSSNRRIRRVEGIAAPTTLNIGVGPGGAAIEDTTPPEIVSTAPADGDTEVDPNSVNDRGIIITFNKAISIDQNIEATIEFGESVLSWRATETSGDGTVVTLKPTTGNDLDFETTYTVVLSEIADEAGNTSGEFRFTFTTQTAPAQGEGIIMTVVGTGEEGFSGDGGPATEARLASSGYVFVDGAGNLFIADFSNHHVRRVDAQTGIITTVAGTGEGGFSGDGGKATKALLNGPQGVFVDGVGNLFIADSQNSRIRRVDGQTGIITTVAGTSFFGFSGDGVPATEAQLRRPTGVFVDGVGNLFIADTQNHRIRRVDGQTGVITTVAGTGDRGFSGDGGPATEARLSIFRKRLCRRSGQSLHHR